MKGDLKETLKGRERFQQYLLLRKISRILRTTGRKIKAILRVTINICTLTFHKKYRDKTQIPKPY